MKKILTLTTKSLLVVVLLLVSGYLQAQVTVGGDTAPNAFSILEVSTANVQGGLRLPHLSTNQRNALDFSSNPSAAHGLVIYNTTTQCMDYWNNGRWVSLCEGNSQMLISPAPCTTVNADGTGCDSDFGITDPDCPAGPFTFTIVAGSDYASLLDIDEGNGSFKVRFQPNNSISQRSIVVRVTSTCTSLYKDFLFSQQGQICTDLDEVPEITSVPAITGGTRELDYCAGGAVYLSIPTGTTHLDEVIWTRNDVEIARGVSHITVTQAGTYNVYKGIIGCNKKNGNPIVIKKSADSAPSPVDFIVVGNNGVACGTGGTVQLIVRSVTSGTIVWYKNGEKTAMTGTQISAGKGDWFAVVEDNNCISRPTSTVTVVENNDGGAITDPVMKINGLTSGWTLCKGGSMFLEIVSPESDVKYTWYINNEDIGTGSGIYYPVPASDEFVLRLRATGAGCSKEALIIENIGASAAPSAPFIKANTDDVLCGGEATLTASGSTGAASYRWFRNGEEIPGKTSNTITINQTGSYTVSGISAVGCSSVRSGVREITASDFATVMWVNHPKTVDVGDTKTYSVVMDFPQGATYKWDITPSGAAVITNGQGTNSVTVYFPTVSPQVTVSCIAGNACGTSTGILEEVEVKDLCQDASITGASNLNVDTKVNQAVTLSITARGNGLTYQWYNGGIPVPNGTSSNLTFQAPGTPQTLTYYCEVKAAAPCNTVARSSNFYINVTANPDNIATGTGSFTGKTCFDIAFSNDNSNSCAPLTSRSSQKTVFSNRGTQDPTINSAAPFTGLQVYTFTPTGTVSKVRFDYVDESGEVIQSITPNSTGYANGTNISTPCKVTVNFNPNLDNSLKGTTRETGLKASLYVIYNNNALGTGDERKLKISLNLQDCACCGARTADGSWLTFMCHNLGADEGLDPFSFVEGNADGTGGTMGYLYQWGRGTDGHQRRNSQTTQTFAKNITATNPANIQDKFVSWSAKSWLLYPNDNNVKIDELWGNGSSTDVNPPKGVNDPCPPGWKVPSAIQWQSIFTNSPGTDSGFAPSSATANLWVWTGKGYKVGDSLYLPAAGFRTYTGGTYPGADGRDGFYWASSQAWYSWGRDWHPARIYFTSTKVVLNGYESGTYGYSVRCIAE